MGRRISIDIIIMLVVLAVQTALAGKSDDVATQQPRDQCQKDSDCTTISSRDHCEMLAVSKKKSRRAKEELAKPWGPKCFGPARYCIPKCKELDCVCEDGGKAPD